MGTRTKAKASQKKGSLYTLLLPGALAVSLVYLVIQTTMTVTLGEARINQDLAKQKEDISLRLGRASAEKLWQFNLEELPAVVEPEFLSPDLIRVEVRDQDNRPLLRMIREGDKPKVLNPGELLRIPPELSVWETMFIDLYAPNDPNFLLGRLVVTLSDSPQKSQLNSQLWSSLLLQFILVLVLVSSMVVVVQVLVIRRLMRLESTMERFGNGELDVREIQTGNDEISRLTGRFNAMAGNLADNNRFMASRIKERTQQLVESERMATLGRLVSGMSHELNTPLGVAVTSMSFQKDLVERLASSWEDQSVTRQEMADFLAQLKSITPIVVGSLEKMAGLTHAFKDISGSHQHEGMRELVLRDFLEEIRLSRVAEFVARSVEVQLQIGKEVTFRAVPSVMYQIFNNLIVNTMIHGFPEDDTTEDPVRKRTIIIHAQKDNGALIVHYRDNGKGITPENQARIYDPFFTTQRGKGGTGLGMYTVWSLIKDMGGSIHLDSMPGQGVNFTMTFPPVEP